MSLFQPAVKEQAKLRLAIAGPSGSGKTYTALAVATAMGDRVAVIDTEKGSASKYADIFTFDVLNLEPPFHPARFVEAIQDATKAGYDVLIIDSLSHAWNGPGGVLEIVEQASKRFRGNSYAGWQEGTPAHNLLIDGIVSAGLHIIGTMRSKQEYILVERNGKQAPQKVGMAPVQRDSFEYEFDVYIDMDMENNGIVNKTRCPALTGKVLPKPGGDLAEILIDWLSGAPPSDRPKPQLKASPNGTNNQANGNPEREPDSQITDLRAKLEEHDTCTLQIVLDLAVATGFYENFHHARTAAGKWPGWEKLPDGTEIKPGMALRCKTGLTLFDWLVDRKQDSGNRPLFDDQPELTGAYQD